jgi:PAS domain S-box-containing protein
MDTGRFFRLAIEASPAGVLVVDLEGTIRFVNAEIERLFGYTHEELIGHSVEGLLTGDLRLLAWQRDGFDPPESLAATTPGEILGRRKDGSAVPIEIALQPIRTAEDAFVVASLADVSERLRLERERRAAHEDQLAFERLVADLSREFINIPADQVTPAIAGALRRICDRLGLAHGSFYTVAADGALGESIDASPERDATEASAPATAALHGALERLLAGLDGNRSSAREPIEMDVADGPALGSSSLRAVAVPLSLDGRTAGLVCFQYRPAASTCPQMMHRLGIVGSVFNQVLARQRRDEQLKAASAEAERLKDQLQQQNQILRREVRDRVMTRVVGQSLAVRRVLDQIEQVSATDSTVLLLGETGTGKELFATQLHALSGRHDRTMVRVNCAAIPATLIESELFGREKGAFTGALSRQVGRFELAHHSTIFLDEIGDLPAEVQVKLLRVLEERKIERLGSPQPIMVDTRIIAATHRNLERLIADGSFREDLYYRLNVFPIHVPPLRERPEDIPLLVWRFVEEFSKSFGKRVDSIDKTTVAALQRYEWPGNIRELRNVVERAMIVSTGCRLAMSIPSLPAGSPRRSSRLVDVEKDHIHTVLDSTSWRIRGRDGAADRLGLKPTTLETRMAKLGLRRPSTH